MYKALYKADKLPEKDVSSRFRLEVSGGCEDHEDHRLIQNCPAWVTYTSKYTGI